MKKHFSIIVNGVKHEWGASIITKREVGELAYRESGWYKELLKTNTLKILPTLLSMSATYKNAHPDIPQREGIMESMQGIRVQDGTIFNIYDTSNA